MSEAININEMLTKKKSSCTIFDNEKMALRAWGFMPLINKYEYTYMRIDIC